MRSIAYRRHVTHLVRTPWQSRSRNEGGAGRISPPGPSTNLGTSTPKPLGYGLGVGVHVLELEKVCIASHCSLLVLGEELLGTARVLVDETSVTAQIT